jgi:hypothetical protein
LSADHLQGIDDMAAHLEHAAFKDGEEADRTGTDDGDIRFMNAHGRDYSGSFSNRGRG